MDGNAAQRLALCKICGKIRDAPAAPAAVWAGAGALWFPRKGRANHQPWRQHE